MTTPLTAPLRTRRSAGAVSVPRPRRRDHTVDPVAQVREYYLRRSEHARGPRDYALRHPRATLAAARAVHRLPLLHLELSDAPEGRTISGVLSARGVAGVSLAASGAAVLEVPSNAEALAAWKRKRSVRPKVTRLLESGAAVELIDGAEGGGGGGAAERRRVLAVADASEREHPDPRYRNTAPRNGHLLQRSTWMVVRDARGRPLALAVAAVDGGVLVLEHFRALDRDEQCSAARYLLLARLLEHAQNLGVRHVVANEAPGTLTSGLLHFQRMTGWTLARVRLTRAS